MTTIGPQIPGQASNSNNDENSDDDFMPQLPPKEKKKEEDEDSDDDFMPQLPPDLLAAANSNNDERFIDKEEEEGEEDEKPDEDDEEEDEDDDDDDVIGPLPPTAEDSRRAKMSIAQEIESRNKKMKDKLTGKDEKPQERETWMTELPDLVRKNFGLVARGFRKDAGPSSEGRHEWTETPADKEKRMTEAMERGKRREAEGRRGRGEEDEDDDNDDDNSEDEGGKKKSKKKKSKSKKT